MKITWKLFIWYLILLVILFVLDAHISSSIFIEYMISIIVVALFSYLLIRYWLKFKVTSSAMIESMPALVIIFTVLLYTIHFIMWKLCPNLWISGRVCIWYFVESLRELNNISPLVILWIIEINWYKILHKSMISISVTLILTTIGYMPSILMLYYPISSTWNSIVTKFISFINFI